MKTKSLNVNLCFVFGIFFLSVCLFMAIRWHSIFFLIMKTQLEMTPSSTVYKMWLKNPLPIYLEIYLYNFTNAEEFKKNKSVIPNFVEVGPFLFEESREKVGISWNEEDETVTFNQSKTWRLIEERSENFSVRVTNLNPIASTFAHISKSWKSKLQRLITNTLINVHEPLIVTATAKEWLFDGIPDKFLDICEALRTVADIPIPYNKFGWFYERNSSAFFDGVFSIKTGRSDLSELGMMVTWNNMKKTDHYVDKCALVYGSTGEVIPPLERFQEGISVFSSEICSYLTLKYHESTDVKGLTAYKYVGDESVFDNGTLYPENSCFYVGDTCPSGARNVSSCRYGSPAFISFPHFYLADPQFTDKITGMKADENKHKFVLQVEPITGIPLSVDGSFQINFRVETYPDCEEFHKVPKIYIPMVWFKQTVTVTDEYASMLKLAVTAHNAGSYIFYGLALITILCLAFKIQLRRK